MLVVMQRDATEDQIRRVAETIETLGYEARTMPGAQRTAVGVVGNDGRIDEARLSGLDGVREIIHVSQPFRQASREWKPEDTIVTLSNGLEIGGKDLTVMAGPCSVEGESEILEAAHAVREAGANVLRGGAFKPRTSPYSFQGMGEKGLVYLARAGEATGLPVVTEAVDPESVPAVAEHADIIQIGARNMQNYSLLRSVGHTQKPVLLKRGISATITELLLAAEYILSSGNPNVIVCERGIRGFDPSTRNILDLTAVPLIHERSHLPVIVDPSHGTGSRRYVPQMALAGIAAGADGIMIEVHQNPSEALSDGAQSLYVDQFQSLMNSVQKIRAAMDELETADATIATTR